MADETLWVFVGVLIGIPLGVVGGWVLAQITLQRPSTVLVQKTEDGYIIVEK